MDPDPKTDKARREADSVPAGPDGLVPQDATQDSGGPPLFKHPRWMVGVVLIFGVLAIFAGLANPVWWLIGSPFILALAIYLWVRLATRL